MADKRLTLRETLGVLRQENVIMAEKLDVSIRAAASDITQNLVSLPKAIASNLSEILSGSGTDIAKNLQSLPQAIASNLSGVLGGGGTPAQPKIELEPPKDNSGRETQPLTPAAVEKAVEKGNKKSLGSVFSKMLGGIAALGASLKNMASSGAQKVVGAGKSLFDTIMSNLLEIAGFLTAMLGAFSFFKGWEKAMAWFGENANFGQKIASVLATFIGSLLGLTEEEQQALAEKIAKFFDWIWGYVEKLFEGVKKVFSGLLSGDKGLVLEGLRDIWHTFVDFIGDVAETILAFFFGEEKAKKIIDPLKEGFKELFAWLENLWGFISSIWSFVTGETPWEESKEKILNFFKEMLKSTLKIFDNLMKSFFELFGLGDWYERAKTWVVEKFWGLVESLVELFLIVQPLLERAWEWLKEKFWAAVDIFGSVFSKVFEWVAPIGKWFAEKYIQVLGHFESLIQKLFEAFGLGDFYAKVKQWATNTLRKIIGGVIDLINKILSYIPGASKYKIENPYGTSETEGTSGAVQPLPTENQEKAKLITDRVRSWWNKPSGSNQTVVQNNVTNNVGSTTLAAPTRPSPGGGRSIAAQRDARVDYPW